MIAVILYQVHLVGNDDHGAVFSLFEEFDVAFLVKTMVPHGHGFVDQETVEFHRHGDGKGQSCGHSGGVTLDGFVEVSPQFGKVFHKGNAVLEVDVVDPTDQPDIVPPRQTALKGSPESEGPGNGAMSFDGPGMRRFRPTDEADQGGFTRSIATQDSPPFSFPDFQADFVEHLPLGLAMVDGVAFADLLEFKYGCHHTVTRRIASWVNKSPMKVITRLAIIV